MFGEILARFARWRCSSFCILIEHVHTSKLYPYFPTNSNRNNFGCQANVMYTAVSSKWMNKAGTWTRRKYIWTHSSYATSSITRIHKISKVVGPLGIDTVERHMISIHRIIWLSHVVEILNPTDALVSQQTNSLLIRCILPFYTMAMPCAVWRTFYSTCEMSCGN